MEKSLDIHVQEQYDDGVYLSATVEQKPGLLATGETLEELVKDLVGAISAWDEAKRKTKY